MEPTPSPTPPPPRAPRLPPPLFSWAYLAVCVVVFIPHATMPEPPGGLLLYGPAVASGEWWRVLTSSVEHINAWHILANGLSIWSFGAMVERGIGSLRLLISSVIAALTSAAAALGFTWYFQSAGASGVIAGWLGLALVIFGGRARKVLVQWTILLVLISLIPRVSWSSHLGGFLGGLACGLLIRQGARARPTEPFRTFDRLWLPLLALAALAVVVVVRFHAGASLGSLRA